MNNNLKTKNMAKYSKKLAYAITELIREDLHTISEICRMAGINRKTFYEWKKAKPEFKEEVIKATDSCYIKRLPYSLLIKLREG